MNQTHKLAVMVSGSGTLLERMIADGLPIDRVIADKPCRGLELAEAAHISIEKFFRTHWGWDDSRSWKDQPGFNRDGYSEALAVTLNDRQITICAMAGFMTVLSPDFFETYKGVLLNIHPALLPKYKGERAVADTLEAGETMTGTTIHIAIEELDAGPIIAQVDVPILPDDTVETLHERIKQTERPTYSRVLRELLEGDLELPPH